MSAMMRNCITTAKTADNTSNTTTMNALIKIPRNKINAKHEIISKVWPGASLSGHFIAGKPVANRAWLSAPHGSTKSTLEGIIRAANLTLAN